MTDAQHRLFHEKVAAQYSLEAKLQNVREQGGSLMVKSLINPNLSISGDQFMQEIAGRDDGA